jgi:hypothetical protein
VIYVGNVGNGTITSYPLPSTGNVTPSATNTSSSLNGPYSETLDAAGDLWVANFGGGTLTEFSQAQLASSGAPTPIVTISSNGTSLETPEGLGFTPSGDLWVVDTHGNGLSMFTPAQLAASGTPTPTVAITGSAFDEPEGLAVTASGGLLVANYGDSNLLEYSASQLVASGSPTPAVTLAGSGLNGPFDVALDAGGNAWVCNYGSNHKHPPALPVAVRLDGPSVDYQQQQLRLRLRLLATGATHRSGHPHVQDHREQYRP